MTVLGRAVSEPRHDHGDWKILIERRPPSLALAFVAGRETLNGDGIVVPPELERGVVFVAEGQVGDRAAVFARGSGDHRGFGAAAGVARRRPLTLTTSRRLL